jgi:acylphosphatase
MVNRLEAKVIGEVQGVMFRDFVSRKARKLRLVGFVRNESDGSVRVVAEGTIDGLEALVAKLWKGPLLTRIRMKVTNVETKMSEATNEFSDFVIKYD